jgi:hypothetical protein
MHHDFSGGDPYDFYCTYQRELRRLGLAALDPDGDLVQEAVNDWGGTKANLLHPTLLKNRSKSSTSILGVDLKVLKTISKDTELSCLRMLLSLLEGDNVLVTDYLRDAMDDSILLQNMENVYKHTFARRYEAALLSTSSVSELETNRTTAVLYLTLISTLASTSDENDAVVIDDLLASWKERCVREGRDVDALVASVEIIGKNGTVQRAYFPVPTFVTQFWQYPETQNAKNELIAKICRDSPEEKVSDYFHRMQSLIQVMRRQEMLRFVLNPWLHAFLGGSSGWSVLDGKRSPVPDQRKVFLYMSIVINVYMIYTDYGSYQEDLGQDYLAGGWFRRFLDWREHQRLLLIVYASHFGIACLLFSRCMSSRDNPAR